MEKETPQGEIKIRECQEQPMASQDSQGLSQAGQDQPIREEGT